MLGTCLGYAVMAMPLGPGCALVMALALVSTIIQLLGFGLAFAQGMGWWLSGGARVARHTKSGSHYP